MISEPTETFAELAIPVNPFPGLRPFEFDESHLFFGRDGQSEQLINKLGRTRFLAVVGTSGSGKSSLVRAGLMPSLLGGFMSSAGSTWRIAIMRPGNDPIGNLARALNSQDVFGSEIKENATLQMALAEATLQRGSRGLVDAVRQAVVAENENLLVVVDQFEEIFRFARVAEGKEYRNEAAAFVKLLLEASRQREIPIYIVLTMRSDYLGDCSQFWGLPEAINESQYLIPRLTRDQLREAMTGPINVARGDITPRLVARLLNDVGDDQDQLPVLQHLLMRVWDECKEKRLDIEITEGSETVRKPHKQEHTVAAIDMCCYEAVGGMAAALSRHADEAFNELPNDRVREVAEKLFKALAEKGEDSREVRRPVTLGEICATAGATAVEVITVIEAFRHPHKSFLMPPAGVPLDKDSLIDISHESLIRGWSRLKKWTEEEAQSARIYNRLAETAVLHEAGLEGLLKDPALQVALDWREKNKPNQAWARRYHPEFETARSFLDKSVAARDADIAEHTRQQKRDTSYKRTRKVVAFLVIMSAVQLGMFFYTYGKNVKANAGLQEAIAQQKIADEKRQEADQLRVLALHESQAANAQAANATEAANEAEVAMKAALNKKNEAELQMRAALVQRDRAQQLKALAEDESARARVAQDVAERRTEEAEAAKEQADIEKAAAIGSLEKAETAEKEAIKQRDLAQQRLDDLNKARVYGEEQRQLKDKAEASATDAEQQIKQVGERLQTEVLSGLRPEAATLAAKLIAKAREKGIEIRVVAGYRSLEQQKALYDQGRTAPGSRVTNARFGSHNTGLAFDVAVFRNGKPDWSSPDLEIVGALGQELGLVWGGSWKKLIDKPHFETQNCQEVLKALLKKPEAG